MKKKKGRRPRSSRPAASPAGIALGPTPGPWKKGLFAAITTLSFFLLLELLLAILGVKPVLYEQDPFVGFAANIPLFQEEIEVASDSYLVTNPNKRRWFNLQRFPKRKAPGAYRIFSLGGSTTYGRPYDDSASFSGWLRELLVPADPSRTWEVINAGGISYASYRVAVVMEELIQYEPDLFIIYTGHNEFLERRTYRALFEAPKPLTTVSALLSRTRIYAAGNEILTSVSRNRDSPAPGTELKSEVDTMLANSVGPQDYTRDDAFREKVLAHYRFNLDRMIDMARSAGAKVVLVIPAANLKDCSPFKSEHSPELSAQEIERFENLMARAKTLREQGRLELSLSALEQAQVMDDRYADLLYQKGLVLYDLGRYAEAKEAFQQAVDEDICPLRALTAIQEIVRETALQREVPLLDFAAEIEDQSDHGIPGSDHFLDHVHLAIEGYRLLALRLIDTLAEQGVVRLAESWSPEAIEAVTRRVEGKLDQRTHGAALRNLAKVFDWAGKLEEAERLARKAAELVGEDAATHHLLGRNAEGRGQWEEAIRHYRRALDLDPAHAEARSSLGMALAVEGQNGEAIRHFREALRIRPDHPGTLSNLGAALMSQGKAEEAIRHYRQALRLDPRYAEAHNNLGLALAAIGRRNEAMGHYQRSVEINPGYTEGRSNLGAALIKEGSFDEAIRHLKKAVLVDPDYAKAHSNLGIALSSQGRVDEAIHHYREAFRVEPDSAEAHYNLGIALMSKGEPGTAIRHYREAVRLHPEYAEAHGNLGTALLSTGRAAQALRHLRRAVDIEADSGPARYNLGVALAMMGRSEEALAHLREATRLQPDWPAPLHRTAWILATDRTADVRDGPAALRLARQAVELSGYRDPAALDALAAACAEVGDFTSAVKFAERGLRLYAAGGAAQKAASLRARLAGYRQERPYRQGL